MVKKRTDFETAYGTFPSFGELTPGDEGYTSVYNAALNWCAAAFTAEELKAQFITYLEDGDELVTNFDLVPAHYFVGVGKIAYVRRQGVSVSEQTLAYYDRNLKEIRKVANKRAIEKAKQDACKPVVRSPLFDIYRVGEALEDLIDAERLLNTSDGYDLLVKNKTRQGLLKALKERFRQAQDEYLKARTEHKEYFETVPANAVKYRLRCYARILEDVEAIMHNKKAARKKVVRRASTEKKVKNVTYCQVDEDLKIQSADPTAIIGAPMVLLYNRKRRRITVLVAATAEGLTVKGTTVQGFDSEKSVTKTLRNPQRQVTEFRRADRARRIDVLLGQIRGKSFSASGRLNADTLILKVVNN